MIWVDMQGVIGRVTDLPEVQEELRSFYERLRHMSDVEKKNVVHPQIQAMQKRIIEDIRKCEEYALYIPEDETFLGNALKLIYDNTGHQFVILIDEWDCVFRNNEEDKLLQDKYIEWLRKMFKDNELLPVYSLMYMTGILPIKRYGTQSALNNFDEYTFLEPLITAEFAGFTEGEVKAHCNKYNDENALSCIVQIAYYQAQDDYKLFRELPAGKGFADVVFLPRPGRTLPAIVVELKWNDNAVAAIDQIKDRQYGETLKDYVGEILLVGISYDKDIEKGNKKHTCRIERMRVE